MLRDDQPRYQLGFGVTSDKAANIRSAPDPNSSIVSKTLHGHPVMRFFAVTAATMVASHVAGKIVESGGKKLLETVADKAVENKFLSKRLGELRDVQSLLDDWQGILRNKGDLLDDAGNVVKYNFAGDKLNKDTVGFWATKGEQERAAAQGLESDAEWTMRNEVQRRLVSTARRLPYELPAGYIAQRAFIDPLFGTNQDDKPKWYNPVDVLGDFAEQGIKNAASLLAFDGLAGAATQSFNKIRFPHSVPGAVNPLEQKASDVFVSLDASLRLIGHDASNVLYQASRVASRAGSSFNAGIQEAIKNTRTITENANKISNTLSEAARKQQFTMDVAQNVASNVPGFFGRLTPFYRGFSRTWQQTAQEEALRNGGHTVLGTGGTLLEDYAESIEGLMGHGDVMSSPFAREEVQSHYKNYVKEYLTKKVEDGGLGIDQKAADEALTRMRFKAPRINPDDRTVARRVAIGNVGLGNDFFEGQENDVAAVLARRMRDIKGGDKIAQNIDDVIRHADQKLADNYDVVTSTINRNWQAKLNLIGRHSAKTFKQRAMPYDMFGRAPDDVIKDYLTTRSAQTLGISLENKSAIEVRRMLAQRGIDATDVYQMRGFLTQRNLISKPGSTGFNLFGLRKLSAEDAMNRGYFGKPGEDASANRVTNVLKLMDKHNPIDPRLRASTFGHVYETASGKIVDLSGPVGSIKSALDSLATEYKIPVINIKPLNMFGWDVGAKMRHTPSIQFSGGYNRHPFVGNTDSVDRLDDYMWFRGKGSKGRLYRSSFNGSYDPKDLGVYRPMTTSETSLAGKTARLAIGNKGQIPDAERAGFAKAFDIDEDQPESLFRGVKRWRDRKNDIFNEVTIARKLREGSLSFDSYQKDDLASAARLLFSKFRSSGISHEAARAMPEGFMEGNLSPQTILGAKSPTEIKALLKNIKSDESGRLNSLTGEAKNSQESIYRDLVQRHLNVSRLKMDSPAAQMNRSATIHRVQDQIKNDLLQYSMISKALTNPGTSMDQEFASMMERLGTLKAQGAISGKEFIETQTALLSTQLNFAAVRMGGTATAQDKLIEQLALLQGPGAISTSSALDNIAKGKTAQYGRVGSFIKSRFGMSSYRYPGEKYNPFGSNTAFVPTFGTAFNRNPIAALKSVVGINTYNNPEGFSGASIPLAHSVQRLNKYFSALGMGIDETAYKGPLDLFARGMVGKRILPIYATAVTAMALDRTAGSMVYGRDQYGQKQYKPLVTGLAAKGIASSQILMAGLLPGGKTAQQKREDLYTGEVPVRKGRWWILGQTPWKGGNEEYFRPSWYRRFMSGYMYDKQYGYSSPLEKLAFGYDFSPLRPLDPYRFERNTMHSRPYPTTGEYFSGPWGPLNPVLNSTLGRILKPQQVMHKAELEQALNQGYQPSGQYGAIITPSNSAVQTQLGRSNDLYESAGTAVNRTAAGRVQASLGSSNAYYSSNSTSPATASRRTKSALTAANSVYDTAGGIGYGKITNYTARVIPNQPAISTGSIAYQSGAFGYRSQEMLGIYGFAGGALRSSLGLGNQNFVPSRPTLASASNAYGASRSFWDLNLGGVGDFQSPFDTGSNLELSELVRRFVPQNKNINDINPLTNDIGKMYPWLPGPGDVHDFHHGDPYSMIPEGEMRLPGPGYDKLHKLHSDYSGQYGLIDRFAIIGDIAPWSNQFRMMQKQMINSGYGDNKDVQETIKQAAAVNQKHDFKEYQYEGFGRYTPGGIAEWLSHRDTYINRKFFPDRTAVEDWERNHVYGTQFAEWQCLDTETQVLTDDGWKYYDELNQDHKLWTINPESSLGEWADIDVINIYDYSGKMYTFKGRTVNAVVTPNHRWLVTSQTQCQKSLYWFEETEHLKTTHMIPRALPAKDISVEIVPDAFVRLMGWIVTEGCYSKSQKNHVSIYQSESANPQKCLIIETILEELKCKWTKYSRRNGENTYGINGQFGLFIKTLFPDKILTLEFINLLSNRQRLLLIETLVMGDGSSHGGGSRQSSGKRYSTTRLKEAEITAILLAQAGVPFSQKTYEWLNKGPDGKYRELTEYRFELHTNKYWRSAQHAPEIVDYEGKVWCPTSKNNTIFIKRNGITSWTGNSPIKDFLKPMINKATTRNPFVSALGGSAVGAIFGASPRGRVIGSFIGAGVGFAAGFARGSEEVQTGRRFLPLDYKKQLAAEEYVDILSYLKNRNLYALAQQAGDQQSMTSALRGIRNTMYGADIYGSSPQDLAFALPKDKREHFLAMLQAPKSQRRRILSTSGRLERRIYEAAWGEKVEKRPDLRQYFSEHELPASDSDFWTTPENMDDIKIKVLQSMNLNPKQVGYYPQEIQRANLRNPAYPQFESGSNRRNVEAQLEQILRDNGIRGSVTKSITPYPSNQIVLNSGIFS